MDVLAVFAIFIQNGAENTGTNVINRFFHDHRLLLFSCKLDYIGSTKSFDRSLSQFPIIVEVSR